jgi:Winged helix DNA-binding domain
MLGLTPGNLIIQLRKLEEAGYLSSEKTRNGSAQKTTVALTRQGRKALDAYTQALRDLLGGLSMAWPTMSTGALELQATKHGGTVAAGPEAGHREPERAQPAVALTSRTCRIASCTPPVHGLPCPGRTRSAEIPSRRASDPTAWAASAVKGAT